MVKIPGLDDLKKLGNELMDAGKMSGMLDNVPGSKKVEPMSPNAQLTKLMEFSKRIDEISEAQTIQTQFLGHLKKDVEEMVKQLSLEQLAKEEEAKNVPGDPTNPGE